jgi:hypothetical protein
MISARSNHDSWSRGRTVKLPTGLVAVAAFGGLLTSTLVPFYNHGKLPAVLSCCTKHDPRCRRQASWTSPASLLLLLCIAPRRPHRRPQSPRRDARIAWSEGQARRLEAVFARWSSRHLGEERSLPLSECCAEGHHVRASANRDGDGSRNSHNGHDGTTSPLSVERLW